MITLGEIKTHAPVVRDIAARRGARNIRIFGSVARGENDETSDVDFLVEMDKDCSFLDLVAVERELSELLQCKVDVVVDGGISPYLKNRIYAEAIAL